MRTALVASAFLLCVAMSSSQGQVYSSNGVGYVNVTLRPGFNLIANPLMQDDNSIGALFENIQGGVPDGLTVYRFDSGGFEIAGYDMFGGWSGGAVTKSTGPGEGVIVYLPGSENRVLTFVGYIPQGEICTEIPHGFSVRSNLIPQTTTLDRLAIPHSPGDVVYTFSNSTKSFQRWELDDPFLPIVTIPVGQAFWLYHNGSATTWCRTFFLNNPQ
jgi:hypothetical protein